MDEITKLVTSDFQEKSEKINELLAALAVAQGQFTTPPKNQRVAYKSTEYYFANLATMIEHNKKPMAENGLSITQIMTTRNDAYGLLTILGHASGQYVTLFHPLPDPARMPAQEFGSRLTYARRYSFQTIQGVEGDKDDDGKLANDAAKSAPKAPAAPAPRNHAPQSKKLTRAESELLWAELRDVYGFTANDVKCVIRDLFGGGGLATITKDQAAEIERLVEKEGKGLVKRLAQSNNKTKA